MSYIKDDNCWDSGKYVEEITGNSSENITLEEWENMKNPNYAIAGMPEYYSSDYWNYPLTEIEGIIEGEHEVVLVRFPTDDGYEYRFCEI